MTGQNMPKGWRMSYHGFLLALLAILSTPAAAELCRGYSGVPEGEGPQAGMALIKGGAFTFGSNTQRPEERIAHRAAVQDFWIDRHEVTNAQFAKFVEATGYVTVAERGLDAKDYPDIPADLRTPGALVFSKPEKVSNLADITQWWRFQPGANWRQPGGHGTSIEGKANHPVVQIAYEDALAYASWLGRALPTEAEWEYAARGGLEGATYSWGNSYDPSEGWKANSWQGAFPTDDTGEDGYRSTAPAGCYPPNGYGLYDMTGNVWEYTQDAWRPFHLPQLAALDLRATTRASADVGSQQVVIKGGSFLCAPNFCTRYRPSARQPQDLSLGASHVGFRTVWRMSLSK